MNIHLLKIRPATGDLVRSSGIVKQQGEMLSGNSTPTNGTQVIYVYGNNVGAIKAVKHICVWNCVVDWKQLLAIVQDRLELARS